MISANINFQILLCHSPMLLFSFRILLFPFEFCYSFFWFYYAIIYEFFYSVSNSVIRFWILLWSFPIFSIIRLYSPLMRLPNPIIFFEILLFTFPILLFHHEFLYSVSNSIIRFRIMFFQIRDFVYLADSALGTSNKMISRVPAI